MLALLRNIFVIATILLPAGLNAQTEGGKKNNKANIIMLPGIFHRVPETKGDTTFSYEIFNSEHQSLRPDTLSDPKYIAFIHYYKSYTLASSEGSGLVSSPAFFKKICDYERVNDNEWVRIDRPTMVTTHILEHKDKIIRTDTATKRDPATGTEQRIIYKYYDTEIRPSDGATPEHHHHHH